MGRPSIILLKVWMLKAGIETLINPIALSYTSWVTVLAYGMSLTEATLIVGYWKPRISMLTIFGRHLGQRPIYCPAYETMITIRL